MYDRKEGGCVLKAATNQNDAGAVASERAIECASHSETYARPEDNGNMARYYRARYYNPSVGRFDNEDPVGFGGGDANLYRYVGNGPTDAIDLLGLSDHPPRYPNNVGSGELAKPGGPGWPPTDDYIIEGGKDKSKGREPTTDVAIGEEGICYYLEFKSSELGGGAFQGGLNRPLLRVTPGEIRQFVPLVPGRTIYFDDQGRYLKGTPCTMPNGATAIVLEPGTRLVFGGSADEGQRFIVVGPKYKKSPGETAIIVPDQFPKDLRDFPKPKDRR
jgi:RHS repeat-associated protein